MIKVVCFRGYPTCASGAQQPHHNHVFVLAGKPGIQYLYDFDFICCREQCQDILM